MNERFKELFIQVRNESENMRWNIEDAETFAELIVRECDQYVAKHWDEMEPWMNPGDLLKHFGVEE